ncbi:MAG: hypothetical protein WAU36_10350 [Cyclobacteriaceae bacterium]
MNKLIVIGIVIAAAWYFMAKGQSIAKAPTVDPGLMNQIPNPNSLKPISGPTQEQLAEIKKHAAANIESAKKLMNGGLKNMITPELVNKVVEQTQDVNRTIQEQIAPTVMPRTNVVSQPTATRLISTSPVPILNPLPIRRISGASSISESTRIIERRL